MMRGCSKRFVEARLITSMPSAKSAKPTSSGSSPSGRSWTSWPRATHPPASGTMCPCGSIWPRNLSMRFHGEHHFHAFPYLVRSSSMIEAFGPAMGHKATHPETGDISLRCAGFNGKNDYDRQTPCDQDYLRKLAGDT